MQSFNGDWAAHWNNNVYGVNNGQYTVVDGGSRTCDRDGEFAYRKGECVNVCPESSDEACYLERRSRASGEKKRADSRPWHAPWYCHS